jgi:hypothetical protein
MRYYTFFTLDMLKVIVDLLTLLIGAEGARLLREYGAGETPQALAPRRLPGTPAESEAPGAQINNQCKRN